MDELLKKLAKKARMESAPDVDVVDSVMRAISERKNAMAYISEKPFMWAASLSTAAAVAIGTFAVYAYYAWSNPLSEMSETIAWAF